MQFSVIPQKIRDQLGINEGSVMAVDTSNQMIILKKIDVDLVKQFKNFGKLFSELNPDFDWKKIYAIFKSMPVMKNYQLKWNQLDEKKIKEILVEQHDFSEERINNLLKKYNENKEQRKQKGLGDFSK